LLLRKDSATTDNVNKVIDASEARGNMKTLANPAVLVDWRTEADIQSLQQAQLARVLVVGVVSLGAFALWPGVYWLWKALSRPNTA